jgi:hypothetical protein
MALIPFDETGVCGKRDQKRKAKQVIAAKMHKRTLRLRRGTSRMVISGRPYDDTTMPPT